MHTTSCTSGLVVHVTSDGLGSHSVLLDIFVVTQPPRDPRWYHTGNVGGFSRVEMVVHQHWHSSSVSRDHSDRVHQVLVRKASVKALCNKKLNVHFPGKREALTKEETKVGERMTGVVNVESRPYYSGGQFEWFRMQICSPVNAHLRSGTVGTHLLAVGHGR